jgi:hypothetical protein
MAVLWKEQEHSQAIHYHACHVKGHGTGGAETRGDWYGQTYLCKFVREDKKVA